MTWVVWAVMLILQQASATASSRTRAGRDVKAHAWAAVASNGVWIASSFVAFDAFSRYRGQPWAIVGIALFYTAFAVLGSVGMMHLMIRAEDRKKRGNGA